MVEIKNVSFKYEGGECDTLKNISLTVPAGKVVVLVGESGCGKTTITRLINGLIPYYYKGELNGSVFINGKSIEEISFYAISETVGSVFQNPRAQFFNVDTRAELSFECENRGISKNELEKRVTDTVEKFRIENLMKRSIFELSGGQKQKIACASVSVSEPSIYVMDEPSSNLDMEGTRELKDCISRWKKEGKSIIVSEHRLSYLREVADEIVYVKDGSIAEVFTVAEFSSLSKHKLDAMGLRPMTGEQFNRNVERRRAISYGEVKLSNFNFAYKNGVKVLNIEKGTLPLREVVAIIGHNGAGKSTFARCLCGLERKCKGIVEYEGAKQKNRERLKKCYMVMQDVNHQLFTESVLDEVLISMVKEDEKVAEKILKSLDLIKYKDRHPMSLSGGQKQRTAIASAMAAGRDIMIFDEPTSGLDLYHMKEVAENISRLQNDGRSVFVVTHDLELILTSCTTVLRLEKGEICEQYPLDNDGVRRVIDFFEEGIK